MLELNLRKEYYSLTNIIKIFFVVKNNRGILQIFLEKFQKYNDKRISVTMIPCQIGLTQQTDNYLNSPLIDH